MRIDKQEVFELCEEMTPVKMAEELLTLRHQVELIERLADDLPIDLDELLGEYK